MSSDARFYFVHSFFFSANDTADILASTTYEIEFTSAIEKGNIRWSTISSRKKS